MYNCRFRKCCNNIKFDNKMLENISENISNNNSQKDEDLCDCGFNKSENMFPENPVLGQSYVPIQTINKTFMPCVGLKKGTLFPELFMPYEPNQSIEENAFIEAMNTVKEGCNKC